MSTGMKPPQPGTWITRPRKARRLWQYGTAALIAVSVLPNVLPFVQTILGSQGAFWLYGIVFLAFVIAAWPLVNEMLAKRMRGGDFSLLDGGFGDQFPVELIIVSKERRLGSDRGVVWFSDGFFGFSGAASSFVLAASDLTLQEKGRVIRGQFQELPKGALALKGQPWGTYILVSPLGKQGEDYLRRLRLFLIANEAPEGERFWPPLELYGPADIPRLESNTPGSSA